MKKISILLICTLCILSSVIFFGCGGVEGDGTERSANNITVNVLNYGAKPNDLMDDFEAIQQALDETRESGGTIVVPDGTYLINECLVIYSNQTLKLSANAIIKRNSNVHYMIAVYTDKQYAHYNGTHDVVISGGTWDGNNKIDSAITIANTCHASNIIIQNTTFRGGHSWHCIEINSSKNVTVEGCSFCGDTYTYTQENGKSELIQLDRSLRAYGPVMVDGKEMEYKHDVTVCKDITINNNTFYCKGTPALGNHTNAGHNNIIFSNNTVIGDASIGFTSRGYIHFTSAVWGVEIFGNSFTLVKNANGQHKAICVTRNIKGSAIAYNNVFNGDYDDYYVGGIDVL